MDINKVDKSYLNVIQYNCIVTDYLADISDWYNIHFVTNTGNDATDIHILLWYMCLTFN